MTNSERDRNCKYRIDSNGATPALQPLQIRIQHIKLVKYTEVGPVICINGCILEFSQFAYIKVLILTKIAKFLIYIQMSNNSTLIIAESDSAYSITPPPLSAPESSFSLCGNVEFCTIPKSGKSMR